MIQALGKLPYFCISWQRSSMYTISSCTTGYTLISLLPQYRAELMYLLTET